MDLRQNIVRQVPDVVVHPKNKKDVVKIVEYCNTEKIPVYVYGGGSSVTFGLQTPKGGVMLVMSTHMNKLLSVNEINQTAVVQPGMMGPAYEEALNHAPRFSTSHGYTCGHFPQSFEYSSVGGWVVTLGSGEASPITATPIISLSARNMSPHRAFRTRFSGNGYRAEGQRYPEGQRGVLRRFGRADHEDFPVCRTTGGGSRLCFPRGKPRWTPAGRSFRGSSACPRCIGFPILKETEVGLKLYGVHGTPIDGLLSLRGYESMHRSLCIGTTEGEKVFAAHVRDQVAKICKHHGAMTLTGFATKLWEKTRYREPYMREDLMDYGVIIDTVESGVTWDNLHKLHQGVRSYIKARPQTICMSHASHFYPQGTNLYFIFILKMIDMESYKKFHKGVIEAILKSGGSISHHHGIGKLFSPFMEKHLGKEQMDVLRALKRHFDPNNIMNPGGRLGLDIEK